MILVLSKPHSKRRTETFCAQHDTGEKTKRKTRFTHHGADSCASSEPGFSKYSRVMLSSFIETWYLGEGQLWQSLAGVTSTALPALEANAGLAKEFQRVQHPEDHLGPHQHLSALRQSPDMGGVSTTHKRRGDSRSPPAITAAHPGPAGCFFPTVLL